MSIENFTNTDIGAAVVAACVLFAGFLKATRDIYKLGWKPAVDKWLIFRAARKQRAELILAVADMKQIIERELTVNGGGSMKDMVTGIHRKVENIQARERHRDETSHAAIFELRATGGMTFMNLAFRELVNADENDLLYREYISHLHPDDRTRFLRDLQEAIDNKMTLDSNVRFRVAGNNFTWIRLLARADVRPDGELMGFFGTAILTEN